MTNQVFASQDEQEPLPKFPYAGEQKDAREMYALGQEELAQAGIETGPASCFGDTYAYVFSAKTLGPEAWNASASSWTATVLDGAWHVSRGGEHGDWYRNQPKPGPSAEIDRIFDRADLLRDQEGETL